MPRVRKPSPEQQKSDHVYANACESIINTLLDRYPSNVGLTIASRGLAEFRATSDITQPKPRARKPKAAQVKVEFHGFSADEPKYRDAKSAAANDDARELSHHSV